MQFWLWAALLGALAAPSRGDAALTVSAAISLSEALGEAAAAYRRSGGGPVRLNLAGSNVLARQIVNGAPADVFISADEAQMNVVDTAGDVLEGSRRTVTRNQLAVVASQDRVTEVRKAFPRAGASIRRLAIGDPAAVPAGVYAKAYLERLDLWDSYERRLVPTGNVRGALAAVENGSADAAIVYVTDAARARGVTIALVVPVDQAPAIAYPAAVMARTRHRREAERFLAFLLSAEGRRIFAAHGFLPPAAS